MLVCVQNDRNTVESTTWVLPSGDSHSGGDGKGHGEVRAGTLEVGRRGTWASRGAGSGKASWRK